MEIGIGLEQGLRLSLPQSCELVQEAARLGYDSAWSPARLGQDAFIVCSQWSSATGAVVEGGIATGISVLSIGMWTVPSLASVAATVGDLSGGRFILGIGSGGIYSPEYRRSFGLDEFPLISRVRDYLVPLRRMLAGENVSYEGKTLSLHGVQLSFKPPRVPVYLGALGPQMLRLAGEAADGAALNWCTPEYRRTVREIVSSGAKKAGRDPGEVKLAEYIRVSVDADVAAARRALGREVLGYAMARPGQRKDMAYRGHFAHMGFDGVLSELEAKRDAGASFDDLIDAAPDDLLLSVGYFGRPEGAAAALRRLAEGLDHAVVRVVPARPGVEAVRAVMIACRPS